MFTIVPSQRWNIAKPGFVGLFSFHVCLKYLCSMFCDDSTFIPAVCSADQVGVWILGCLKSLKEKLWLGLSMEPVSSICPGLQVQVQNVGSVRAASV